MVPLSLVIGNRRFSSWSMRPWLVLRASGLPFETELVPFHDPEFKAKIASPSGKVPLLRHGELALHESLAIAEYVAELAPEAHLYPEARAARALARSLAAEMHAGFGALRKECPMDVLRRFSGHELSPAAKADVARATTLFRETRAGHGAGGPFLFGPFGVVDAMFAPLVTRLVTYGIAVEPEVRAYVDAVMAHPAVREWIEAAEAEADFPPPPSAAPAREEPYEVAPDAEPRFAEHVVEPLFLGRWSPRAMSGDAVSVEEIGSLLEAARWAPSAFNAQPWRYTYARARTPGWDTLFELLMDANKAWCARAGALFLVTSKTTSDKGTPNGTHAFDAGSSFMSFALEGRRLGLVVHGMAGFDAAKARIALAVPDDHAIHAMIAVGRPGRIADLPERYREREKPSGRRSVEVWATELGAKQG